MADVTNYRKHWDDTYREAYADGRRHWRAELAIPRAFEEFMRSRWAPPVGARILEAGCGDGLNVIHLTRMGYSVTGVDVSEAAIARAREAAAEADVEAEFLCLDIVCDKLPRHDGYDLWVDIKTLHCLWEDADRQRYLAAAASALREHGILFLNCALALADVRCHFPAVFEALDPQTRAQADTLDRDLPIEARAGIRCETLDWYCQELKQAGFSICEARREATIERGWGIIVIAQHGTRQHESRSTDGRSTL